MPSAFFIADVMLQLDKTYDSKVLHCSESSPSAALRLLKPLLHRYCPVWIVGFAIFIGGGFYEHLQGGELGYFLVALFMALPCVVYPLVCPGDADKGRPMLERCGLSDPAL